MRTGQGNHQILGKTASRRTHGELLLEEDNLGGGGVLQQLTSAELGKQTSCGSLFLCVCLYVCGCVLMCMNVCMYVCVLDGKGSISLKTVGFRIRFHLKYHLSLITLSL